MREFRTDKEALDYLSGRIAAEAAREGSPLSEIERKMLYFSETDWTLPEMAAVSNEFEQAYDEDQYERKIAGLIRKVEAHGHSGNHEERQDWNNAVEELSDGDHYIQVMLSSSFSPLSPAARRPHDRLKLWLTAFAIVFGFFGLWALLEWIVPAAADWVFDRNRFGVFVILVLVVWAFRDSLRDLLKTLFHRW